MASFMLAGELEKFAQFSRREDIEKDQQFFLTNNPSKFFGSFGQLQTGLNQPSKTKQTFMLYINH